MRILCHWEKSSQIAELYKKIRDLFMQKSNWFLKIQSQRSFKNAELIKATCWNKYESHSFYQQLSHWFLRTSTKIYDVHITYEKSIKIFTFTLSRKYSSTDSCCAPICNSYPDFHIGKKIFIKKNKSFEGQKDTWKCGNSKQFK